MKKVLEVHILVMMLEEPYSHSQTYSLISINLVTISYITEEELKTSFKHCHPVEVKPLNTLYNSII